MMFFLVFKSPAEGRTRILRPNEPFAQFTVIPEESDFELIEMSDEEAAERELQASAHPRKPRYPLRGHSMDIGIGHGFRRDLPAHSWRGEKTSAALARRGVDQCSAARRLSICRGSPGLHHLRVRQPAVASRSRAVRLSVGIGLIGTSSVIVMVVMMMVPVMVAMMMVPVVVMVMMVPVVVVVMVVMIVLR